MGRSNVLLLRDKVKECVVDDVCGDTHTIRNRPAAFLHGRIGSFWPVVLDGVRGHFEYASVMSTQTLFVPARGVGG